MAPRQAGDPTAQPRFASDLATELATMQRIAMALSDLHDQPARARVLRWAMERFDAAPVGQPVADRPLAPLAPAPPAARDQDATLAVDGIVELFDEAVADPDVQRRRKPAVPAHEPIESMVRGFVADFQQLASEWHGA